MIFDMISRGDMPFQVGLALHRLTTTAGRGTKSPLPDRGLDWGLSTGSPASPSAKTGLPAVFSDPRHWSFFQGR